MTRFGEISPLKQNCKKLLVVSWVTILIFVKIVNLLWQFLYFWANFHCSKWPIIKNLAIRSHRIKVTIVIGGQSGEDFSAKVICKMFCFTDSVIRFGDLLDFGQLFKARINLPKSPTVLGNFCVGDKILNFSREIIFGQLLWTFGNFSLVTVFTDHNNLGRD